MARCRTALQPLPPSSTSQRSERKPREPVTSVVTARVAFQSRSTEREPFQGGAVPQGAAPPGDIHAAWARAASAATHSRAFAASRNAGSAGSTAGVGAARRSADARKTDDRRTRPENACKSSVAPHECGAGEADALGGERVGVSEGVRVFDAVPDPELLALPVAVEELDEVAVAVAVAVAVLLPVAECVAEAVGAKLGTKDKRVMTPGGTCGRPKTESPRTHGWGPPAVTGGRASDTLPEKLTRSAGTRPLR